MSVDQEEIKKMVDLALSGKFDPYCPIKIGDKVEITMSYDADDMHEVGSKGVVVGNLFIPEEVVAHVDPEERSAYLVQFEQDPEDNITFIIGNKIKKI